MVDRRHRSNRDIAGRNRGPGQWRGFGRRRRCKRPRFGRPGVCCCRRAVWPGRPAVQQRGHRRSSGSHRSADRRTV
ncbi:UNVERIFIED_CONTAM: hypothetical protein GTU68_007436, partial [Idotea baltica]|nr:hypothetical protein [Idotea baltica]